MITEKYRLNILQEIAKKLASWQFKIILQLSGKIVKTTPENITNYLTEKNEHKCNVVHSDLGNLDQFLKDDKNDHQIYQIVNICQRDMPTNSINFDKLKRPLSMFFSNIEDIEEVDSNFKIQYDNYLKPLNNLKKTFYAFKRIILQPKYKKLNDLWIESYENENLQSKLVEEMKKEDLSLYHLYSQYYSQYNYYKSSFDWTDYCKDQVVIDEYVKHIKKNGLFSKSYRELLAAVFDVNIRLYFEDQNDNLIMHDEHNPDSETKIYLLCRDDQIIQLSFDVHYFEYEQVRNLKNELFAGILSTTNKFKQKHEIDDYLRKCSFLFETSLNVDDQYVVDEDKVIEEILKYFPREERKSLEKMLEKISLDFIGQSVLPIILNRFSCDEKALISSQEFFVLVNSIIKSVVEDRNELRIFCWIITALPQKNWINELILLELENYFRQIIEENNDLRINLSKIDNTDILLLFKSKFNQLISFTSITIQSIENTFYLLAHIQHDNVMTILENLELSEWPYALKEKYWAWKLSKLVNWTYDDLPTASYHLLSIENFFGVHVAEQLIEAMENKKSELTCKNITYILSKLNNENANMSFEKLKSLNRCRIDQWANVIHHNLYFNKNDLTTEELIENMRGRTNISTKIRDKLEDIKSCVENTSKVVVDNKSINRIFENDFSNWTKSFKRNIKKRKRDMNMYKEMLAMIDRAIQLKRNFKLRNNQKLAVISLLTNDRTLAQVPTGEGKTLILVAASIIRVLFGDRVHIVTSSSVLAKRDAEDNEDIYRLFGIKASHNCSENQEDRREAYSENQVIYGELGNFQKDYLLEKFYGEHFFQGHNFNVIFIDEVDSMLLDKCNNTLYLSHNLENFDKLEAIYIYIWQMISTPDHGKTFNDLKEDIKETVFQNLYNIIYKSDLINLSSELSLQQTQILWKHLVNQKLLNDQGILLNTSITKTELGALLPAEFRVYTDRLYYLFNECMSRKKFIHVPNHLKPFIEDHLDTWIDSARTAYYLKENEDYINGNDDSSPDLNANIIILDIDTGTDQKNSQWDEAIHQFLQLKHGCKLSLLSLKAVFISNVSYIKLYTNLYGLTGTLGSQIERDLLKELYEVEFVTIPASKLKQFHEESPVICSDECQWVNKICKEAKDRTTINKRSVLIICETVKDVNILYRALGGRMAKNVTTYDRDYEVFDTGFENINGSRKLGLGQIIIATNLAGRGTDIKITEELKNKGGLHVILTYLPKNIRVEKQGFGRASRNGDEGSGQIIIRDSKGQSYTNFRVVNLKKQRDTVELQRISGIKLYYHTKIQMEEKSFRLFQQQYEGKKKYFNDTKLPNRVKEILLQSCLDRWAFWLDQHRNFTNKENMISQLDFFISQIKSLNIVTEFVSDTDFDNRIEYHRHESSSWIPWVQNNPVQMLKLGLHLYHSEHSKEKSIQLFDNIIKTESQFCEVAHYYKALALIKKGNNFKHQIEIELRNAASLIDKRCQFAYYAASVVDKLKLKEGFTQNYGFEEQQKNVINVYSIFLQSIFDILGHSISPQTLVNCDIDLIQSEILFENLLDRNLLKKSNVVAQIADGKLKEISCDYAISIQELQNTLQKYKGKEIIEKNFIESLGHDLKLPNREEFWKLLIERHILFDEMKYVIFDKTKLNNIDPSMFDHLNEKISRNKLKNFILETKNEEIFFNKLHAQQENVDFIFEEQEFIKIIGSEKYKVLKMRNICSSNRKATVNSIGMNSIEFPCYDSISLKDFAKVNICEIDAKQILQELLNQNIIERKSNEFVLKIKFDKINQLRLLFCPVYELITQRLLFSCFAYRIELQKLEKNVIDKNYPLNLQLPVMPHYSLAADLYKQDIIRPVTVEVKDTNLKETIEKMYSKQITKESLKRSLAYSFPEDCLENLFKQLVEKNWITRFCTFCSTYDFVCNLLAFPFFFNPVLFQQEILAGVNSCNHEGFYVFNSPEYRQTPLLISSQSSVEHELLDIDKTVEKLIETRKQQTNIDTIKMIASVLERSKSLLKTIENLDGELKPTKLTEIASVEDIHIFYLNSLDQLLILHERKYTWPMIGKTFVIVALGSIQIIIGAYIDLQTLGAGTFLNSGLIQEGLNDISYAINACNTGYLNFTDYLSNKWKSVIFTSLTGCVGALLSRGIQVSYYGYQIGGPGFLQKMPFIIENFGGEDALSRKMLGLVAFRFFSKVTEGIILGLTNIAVDKFVENYLQNFCKDIATEIYKTISSTVKEHNIYANLEVIFKLQKNEARNTINNLIYCASDINAWMDTILEYAKKIALSVLGGFGDAIKKFRKAGKTAAWSFSVNAVITLLNWSERLYHLYSIRTISNNFLDALNQKLEERISKLKHKLQSSQPPIQISESYNEDEIKTFKYEITATLDSFLCDKAKNIVEQHILKPVLNECVNKVLKFTWETLKMFHQHVIECELLDNLRKEKKKMKKALKEIEKQENSSVKADEIKKEFYSNLVNLLATTKSPKLFAAIVRENVPMDFTCIEIINSSILPIICPGLQLIIKDDILIIEHANDPDSTKRIILKDKHFSISGTTEEHESNDQKNNCLYDVIAEFYPELRNKMNADQFRESVAYHIEHNEAVRHHIQNGWHQFYISIGVYGGEKLLKQKLQQKKLAKNMQIKQASNEKPYRLNIKAEEMHKCVHEMWPFGDNDYDLRIVPKPGTQLTKEETTESLSKGLNLALKSNNDHVFSITKIENLFTVEDLKPTKYDIVDVTGKNGKTIYVKFPVEWIARKTANNITFQCGINIDNPDSNPEQMGPHGRHIGYSTTACYEAKNEIPKIVGHILLNQNENMPSRDRSEQWSTNMIDKTQKEFETFKLFKRTQN